MATAAWSHPNNAYRKLGRKPQNLVCKFDAILSTAWDMKHSPPTVRGVMENVAWAVDVYTVITTCLSHTPQSMHERPKRCASAPESMKRHDPWVMVSNAGVIIPLGGLITEISARARTRSLMGVS